MVLGAPVQNSAIFALPKGAGGRPWWVAEVPWCELGGHGVCLLWHAGWVRHGCWLSLRGGAPGVIDHALVMPRGCEQLPCECIVQSVYGVYVGALA